MDLEEPEQRQIAERQTEDMIRRMAAATGQFAHTLRAMNRRRFNATPSSLVGDRNDDADVFAQPFVEDRRAEQERLQQERLDRMRQEVNQDMGNDSDLAARVD